MPWRPAFHLGDCHLRFTTQSMASRHAPTSTCSRTNCAASGASKGMWFRIATRFVTLQPIIVIAQRRHKARPFQ